MIAHTSLIVGDAIVKAIIYFIATAFAAQRGDFYRALAVFLLATTTLTIVFSLPDVQLILSSITAAYIGFMVSAGRR